MANKVITVTDPSIVTNDTLAGYNNYSDIDGQLGTTMTPTEATNGKTITLSDGVVHEVTTKPVGTTNGEFSAVVSNAVTVDLSSSDPIPVIGTSTNLTEDPTETYTVNSSLGNYEGLLISTASYSGDFEATLNGDLAGTKGATVYVKTDNTYQAFSADAANYGMVLRIPDSKFWQILNGVETDPTDSDVIKTTSGTMVLRRVSDDLNAYWDDGTTENLVHAFGTVSGAMYLCFSQYSGGYKFVEPRVLA